MDMPSALPVSVTVAEGSRSRESVTSANVTEPGPLTLEDRARSSSCTSLPAPSKRSAAASANESVPMRTPEPTLIAPTPAATRTSPMAAEVGSAMPAMVTPSPVTESTAPSHA